MADEPNADSGAAASPSLEDTMLKAFDAIEAREAGDGGADAGDDEQDTGDEAGDTAAEGADTNTATDEDADTTDQGSEQGNETAKPLDAPASWSAADKEKFAALPREAQEIVARRESEREQFLTQKSQEIAEVKREYEAVDRLIGPRKQAWAMAGHTSESALTHLLALSDFATKDKAGFVRWFSQQHGLDLADLAAGGHSAPDPKLTALEQRVQSFEQLEQQRQQQAQEQARESVRSAIAEFAGDTKAHPHFKDVEGDIADLLPGVRRTNPGASHKECLQIAYDKAVRVNPTTWAKVQADEQRMKALEAANAAKKAKAAAGANVRTSGSASDGKRSMTMDETMSDAYDRAQSRA